MFDDVVVFFLSQDVKQYYKDYKEMKLKEKEQAEAEAQAEQEMQQSKTIAAQLGRYIYTKTPI